MSESIWIHYARPRPQWYRLDAAEKSALDARWAEVEAASVAAGGERVGRYHIRGQHDFQTVDIWRFPSPEAAFDHWARLTAAGYNELFAFSNNVGLPLPEAS
ncbi:hypothetical protein [Pleomorphomonas carboxyditropha]|uniref:Uncharacterized protein n=1 Tax=Pleomorphomonas carboxyditropha TaxID=2023338 RepID=A0A2G9WZG0_9HYPH|nr:hypothetical protein [Pleomorphomonas carboxyditropha]PIP00065.1 hypothetical protein CJ014_04785 [Pleomorphomonas carboxyditropha]